MVTIELAEPWTYRTPEKTIDYPAGKHEVFQYVADAAEKDGALAGLPSKAPPDPLDGSIDALQDHVATITDIAEIDALIRAEEGGKTRKGALDVLEARRAELTGE